MGGITGLLLLLWVGVTGSTAADLQKRITGGQKCIRPYHVIIYDDKGRFVCGGSLISDRWILTAAHCEERQMSVVIDWHSPPPKPIRITEAPVIYRDSKKKHDIMLLKLPQQVRPARRVTFPDCNKAPHIPVAVEMAGHGATNAQCNNAKDGFTPDLHCAFITTQKCSWQGILKHPEGHQHMFCGQTPRVDICSGDSGGGAVLPDKTGHTDTIYGVISTNGPHAHAAPVGFMDVCGYIQWITDTISAP